MVEIILTGVLGAYLALVAGVYTFQDRLVFHPDRVMVATPEQWGVPFQDVRFPVDGASVHGWWIPPERPDAPVVMFFHGNACNISGLRDHLLLFRRLGLGAFLFDYRGYGLSEGEFPNEARVYADADGAWRQLTGVLGVSPRRVIYYGHSLGGGVATWLAERHPPRGLILEGTFTSVPDLGAEVYPFLPVRLLARNKFPNRDRLADSIRVPVLLIHSQADAVVPFHHGEVLYRVAAEPKLFLSLERGEHYSAFTAASPLAEQTLGAFLERLPVME